MCSVLFPGTESGRHDAGAAPLAAARLSYRGYIRSRRFCPVAQQDQSMAHICPKTVHSARNGFPLIFDLNFWDPFAVAGQVLPAQQLNGLWP